MNLLHSTYRKLIKEQKRKYIFILSVVGTYSSIAYTKLMQHKCISKSISVECMINSKHSSNRQLLHELPSFSQIVFSRHAVQNKEYCCLGKCNIISSAFSFFLKSDILLCQCTVIEFLEKKTVCF